MNGTNGDMVRYDSLDGAGEDSDDIIIDVMSERSSTSDANRTGRDERTTAPEENSVRTEVDQDSNAHESPSTECNTI